MQVYIYGRTDLQPDITFFGQALDSEFDSCLFADREKVDLLLIIGTSLKVAPVNEVLGEPMTSTCPSPSRQLTAERIYHTRYRRSSST